MALLAKAANARTFQTIANTSVAAGFDAAQLAVLQQLPLAQTTSNAAPSQPAPPQAPPAQSGSAFSTPSSYREEPYNSHKDRRFNGPQSSDRVNPYDDQPEDRSSSFRGGFRGGFRGRGRGRWDDRDRDRYRERERDVRSPSHRGRRSRSRSPPNRQGGKRPVRPYSPPRRPDFAPMGSRGRDTSDSGPASGDNAGKDEFGRDIRPKSPGSDATPPPKHDASKSPPPPPASPPPVAKQPAVEPSPALTSNHDRMSLSPLIAANTSSSTPSAPFVSSTVSPQPGMEKFNPATFDFTSPASWEALGKMWQVTNGYLPTTEELMQFVMSGGQPAFPSAPTPVQGYGWQNTSGQGWRGRGRGGFARGRGGFGHGNARSEEWPQRDTSQGTDAIVLGGGSGSDMEVEDTEASMTSPTRGGGGRMQRIGDKWVFVRDSVTT